jgi:hypothetical protein
MRTFSYSILLAALVCAGSAMAQTTTAAPAAVAASAPSARPEMGKLLFEIQTLLNAKSIAQAKEKLTAANAFADQTPYEKYLVARLSLNAAVQEDDATKATQYMEQILALNGTSQWVKQADLIALLQNVGAVHFRAKDYVQSAYWMERNIKEGGTSTPVKNVRIQSYLLSKNYARTIELAEEEIALAQKENRAPAMQYLEMLQVAHSHLKEPAKAARAVELLVTHHPKKDYWMSLVNRLWTRADLAKELQLDVFRLGMHVGVLQETADFSDYVDFAQQSGNSGEALKAYDKGVELGLLGTEPNEQKHKKLRAKLVTEMEQDRKTAAADEVNALKKPNGVALANLGFSLVGQGNFDKGIELLEKGIAKGIPKRAEDARLHLGIAYVLAGQDDKARQILSNLSGKDGVSDLGRYWILAMRKPVAEPAAAQASAPK